MTLARSVLFDQTLGPASGHAGNHISVTRVNESVYKDAASECFGGIGVKIHNGGASKIIMHTSTVGIFLPHQIKKNPKSLHYLSARF